MKIVKYSEQSIFLLTNDEFERARSAWETDQLAHLPERNITFPPPKFHPYGDTLPGMDKMVLYYNRAYGELMSVNEKGLVFKIVDVNKGLFEKEDYTRKFNWIEQLITGQTTEGVHRYSNHWMGDANTEFTAEVLAEVKEQQDWIEVDELLRTSTIGEQTIKSILEW